MGGVYSVGIYPSFVVFDEEKPLEYSNYYLKSLFRNHRYKIFVNGIELSEKEKKAVSDHLADTNHLIPTGENQHIEIEIELEKAQELGILFIDFLQPEYGIEEVSCWYYDKDENNYVFLDDTKCIESVYEFYLGGHKTDKIKLIGTVTNNNVGNVMINEIIVLENLRDNT